jgi:hypothetical protein
VGFNLHPQNGGSFAFGLALAVVATLGWLCFPPPPKFGWWPAPGLALVACTSSETWMLVGLGAATLHPVLADASSPMAVLGAAAWYWWAGATAAEAVIMSWPDGAAECVTALAASALFAMAVWSIWTRPSLEGLIGDLGRAVPSCVPAPSHTVEFSD